MSIYKLRYFFDYGCLCLWADNEAARERFDYCVDLTKLLLSEATVAKAYEISEWFSRSLNWKYPPDPGPWRQDECDRFNDATADLLDMIRSELGLGYEVINEQQRLVEDSELDAYLADPKGFHRKVQSPEI